MKLPYTLLNQALKSSSQAVTTAKNASLGQIARKSVQFGPAKDLAMICGRASSAGTAGTLAAYIVTGTMGPAALVAGMGASMGTRWAYRKVVGETLVEAVKAEQESKPGTTEEKTPDVMEEIGPEE